MSAEKPPTPAASQTKAQMQREQAERALAEAAERRRVADAEAQKPAPKELGGQRGPEPTRYGDWEKKGVISDF